ncbi:hypothetical protein DFH07DRAFT_803348 [Mycena maculata]|uniref:Arrestin-like N-terminal domain-containing protein n=1 Tax=Mycena maculata TaxID=230809 RepID=A0AAD7JUB7_9AGAR|nr:hypothetical protein DFH07DRAFT_803348 [Mycena maculata]
MAPSSTTPLAFVLHLPDTFRVSGEIISGHVEFDLARAQVDGIESVRVNLKGCIVTKVIELNSDGSNTTHERAIELLNSTKLLWERGTAFPDPDTHVLPLPFQFRLPDNLPPSFDLHVHHHEASISYAIEVLGTRPGCLRKNRQICKIFKVLPAASPAQILAKRSLKQGWGGPWRTVFLEQKIRQGVWGDYGHARVEAKVPDLTSFPCATAIPLQFCIQTRTKPMSCTDAPEDKSGRPLFPAPPAQSADVKLFFHREANIRALRRNGTAKDSFRIHGSLGDPASTSVKSDIQDAEWIPDPEKKDRGVWKRAVRFETTVSLPFAPTFSTETIECKYSLRFTVCFPGIRNDLKIYVPIHLDPAHACRSPPGWSPQISYADIPPEDPEDLLEDMPPSYWEANNVRQSRSDMHHPNTGSNLTAE